MISPQTIPYHPYLKRFFLLLTSIIVGTAAFASGDEDNKYLKNYVYDVMTTKTPAKATKTNYGKGQRIMVFDEESNPLMHISSFNTDTLLFTSDGYALAHLTKDTTRVCSQMTKDYISEYLMMFYEVDSYNIPKDGLLIDRKSIDSHGNWTRAKGNFNFEIKRTIFYDETSEYKKLLEYGKQKRGELMPEFMERLNDNRHDQIADAWSVLGECGAAVGIAIFIYLITSKAGTRLKYTLRCIAQCGILLPIALGESLIFGWSMTIGWIILVVFTAGWLLFTASFFLTMAEERKLGNGFINFWSVIISIEYAFVILSNPSIYIGNLLPIIPFLPLILQCGAAWLLNKILSPTTTRCPHCHRTDALHVVSVEQDGFIREYRSRNERSDTGFQRKDLWNEERVESFKMIHSSDYYERLRETRQCSYCGYSCTNVKRGQKVSHSTDRIDTETTTTTRNY